MTKGRLTIRIVAGGYLAYVGFGLAKDVLTEKPEHYLAYLLFGIFFMLVGGVWCFLALKRYIKHDYKEIWEDINDDPETEQAAKKETGKLEEAQDCGKKDEISEHDAGQAGALSEK